MNVNNSKILILSNLHNKTETEPKFKNPFRTSLSKRHLSNAEWKSKDISNGREVKVYETSLDRTTLQPQNMDYKGSAEKQVESLEKQVEGLCNCMTTKDQRGHVEKRQKNEEIRERAGWCQEINGKIMNHCLRYFGFINKMPAERYPQIALVMYMAKGTKEG